MLTWRWIRTRSNRFRRSIVSQAAISIVRKGTFRSNHSGSDPTAVIRRGWRQIRYSRLRMWMMMSSRVDRMVMPRRCVRRVIAPALGEALMAGRHGWIGSTGSRSTSGWCCSCRASRVVRLVIGSGTGGTSWSSGNGRRRPKQPGLPVVPGGTGGRGGIGRQVVVCWGIVTPVSLMMI